MLTEATPKELAQYGDFFYTLALDRARSGYPTYADGLKTKADLLADMDRTLASPNAALLICRQENTVEGWLAVDWLAEDRYVQLCGCGIRTGMGRALAELLGWLCAQERFAGCTLYCGVPGENSEAVRFFRNNGFVCIEESWHCVLPLAGTAAPCGSVFLPEGERIEPIGRGNFDALRAVWQPGAETYWNCSRILACLDRWLLLGYFRNDRPAGALLAQRCGDGFEIFGLTLPQNEEAAPRACRALLRAMAEAAAGAGASHIIFLCDKQVQAEVCAAGFRLVGQYLCYTRQL